MIAIRPWRYRVRRLVPLLAAAASTLALLLILEIRDWDLSVAFLVVLFVLIASGLLAQHVNRFGISQRGFAPPHKPLKGLLSDPWILPWEEITAIEFLPSSPTRRDKGEGELLRIESNIRQMEWILACNRFPGLLGREQAVRFTAGLRRMGERIRELGRPLSADEAGQIVEWDSA